VYSECREEEGQKQGQTQVAGPRRISVDAGCVVIWPELQRLARLGTIVNQVATYSEAALQGAQSEK